MNPETWILSEKTIAKSRKQYAHFDLRTDLQQQKDYVLSKDYIAKHGFYPFIHYQLRFDKFSKVSGKKPKTRDICYAAHIDRCIYQYYSFLLNEKYNLRVAQDGMDLVAVAYRTNLGKTNADFSKKAVDFIKHCGDCWIVVGDFTGYFDCLDHQYLKEQWMSLFDVEKLPPDQYAVFKSVTAYSKWERDDILNINGLETSQRGVRELNKKKRVLTTEQFHRNKECIVKNQTGFGIPQGSPISAVLANIYMLETDKAINDIVRANGGLYMRYSDDFIVILPDAKNVHEAISNVLEKIERTPNLKLEPEKTQYYRCTNDSIYKCSDNGIYDDAQKSRISFLGFSFDGREVRIRAKTISKYYYRMNRKAKTIARAGGYTSQGRHISGENLYRKYSERGKKEGNFLTYVDRARTIWGEESIDKDTKRHMQKIRKALNKRSTQK